MFNEYEEVIKIEALMEMLDIGRNSAYKLLEEREIKGFKIGRQWRITKQAVIHYLSQKSG